MSLERWLPLRRDFAYFMRMVRAAMDDLIKIRAQEGYAQQLRAAMPARSAPDLHPHGDELQRRN